MRKKMKLITVILTVLVLSLCACGGSSSETGSSSGSAAGKSDAEVTQPSVSDGVHPSDMTASNDLAPYIRRPLGDILDAFPDFTQLEGGEEHPAYGNDSLWFAFVMRNGEFVCDYIRVRGEETSYTIYGVSTKRLTGNEDWYALRDKMMEKGFDEGGSGELLDSESNCLYLYGLYEDLPYVSLYAYNL